MSMTIYGGMTKNWVEVEGMVDNNNDLVYFHDKNENFFIRLSQYDTEKEAKPCIVIFHNDEIFVPIYAKVLDCSFKKCEDDKFVSKMVRECWAEAEEYGIEFDENAYQLKKQEEQKELNWIQCRNELMHYAKENDVDLCIETNPLTFELLVDKYMELKETYEDLTKNEIIREAIEEWEQEQEADLV